MSLRLILNFLVLIAIGAGISCGPPEPLKDSQETLDVRPDFFEIPVVKYTRVYDEILSPHCLRCHQEVTREEASISDWLVINEATGRGDLKLSPLYTRSETAHAGFNGLDDDLLALLRRYILNYQE